MSYSTHSALLALLYLILVSNANFPEENSEDRFSAAARSILVAAITDFLDHPVMILGPKQDNFPGLSWDYLDIVLQPE